MAAKHFLEMHGGVKIPTVGFGTFQRVTSPKDTDEPELVTALNTALEAGYRHIDTAYAYRNEAIIGRVLKEWFSSGRLKREDIFVTTKLPPQGVHPDRVELFLKRSLESLQLEYVDLYLIHFPIGMKYYEDKPDVREPIPTDHVAVWKELEEQVDAGRTKTIGLSNFNIRQIDRILKSARIKPACLQIELHIYLQQPKLVQFSQQNGIVVVGYCSLGSPGYNTYLVGLGRDPRNLPVALQDPVVKRIAKKHQKTTAQILLRHLLQKDIVMIPKSLTPTRIKENIDLFDFSLDSEDMRALDDLDVGENARIVSSYVLRGLDNHPEWPYEK